MGYVPESNADKRDSSQQISLRPPQVRCAQVIGGRRTPLQKRKVGRKKKAQVKNG
jgi:hypothetical protein